MRSPKAIQASILIAFILVLAAGISFTIWTSNALANGFRFLSQDIGIWAPAQQEREVLRLRELVGQIALGAPISEQEYSLQRDLMFSRFNITREGLRDNPNLFEGDLALQQEIDQALLSFQANGGGRLPSPETARRLGPSLDAMASVSHEFLNKSRDVENRSNFRTIGIVRQLQAVQIGTMVLLCVAGGGLLWVIRRRFSSDLATAYAEAQQRASDLEISQAQLSAANQGLEQQNQMVRQALADLEASAQAQAQLESTVQGLAFPIIPVIEGVLVLPLVGVLDYARLVEAGGRFCDAILRQQARVAIIDITGVPTMDSQTARELLRIARAVTLLGCRPMLVGIAPATAEELVHLGFNTDDLTTKSTLQQAVALALRLTPLVY